MSADLSTVLAKVAHAKNELRAAEEALDAAIGDVQQRSRADKEIIAPALEAAFERVEAARSVLLEIEAMVTARG